MENVRPTYSNIQACGAKAHRIDPQSECNNVVESMTPVLHRRLHFLFMETLLLVLPSPG